MLNPMIMVALAAAQDPARWGPMLDALGPQFGPDVMLGGANALMQGGAQPFAPNVGNTAIGNPIGMTPPPGMGGWDPGLASTLLGPSGVPPVPMGDASGFTPQPGAAPGPMEQAVSLPRPPTAPQVARPQIPQPIMSGGVTGAQKAPELGMQNVVGGTPAQLALAMLLGGGRGATNPLRVPTLGSLLGGAVG